MAISEARKRANAKYDAKHFKTLGLRVKIEVAETITHHAQQHGETVNAFLFRAAREQMRRDNEAAPNQVDE